MLCKHSFWRLGCLVDREGGWSGSRLWHLSHIVWIFEWISWYLSGHKPESIVFFTLCHVLHLQNFKMPLLIDRLFLQPSLRSLSVLVFFLCLTNICKGNLHTNTYLKRSLWDQSYKSFQAVYVLKLSDSHWMKLVHILKYQPQRKELYFITSFR